MGDEKEVVFSERQIIREQLAASILQNLANGRLAATPAGSGRKASLTAQNSLSLAQIECAGRAVPVPGESPPTSPSALKFQDVGIWTTPPHHDPPSLLVLAGDIFTKPLEQLLPRLVKVGRESGRSRNARAGAAPC